MTPSRRPKDQAQKGGKLSPPASAPLLTTPTILRAPSASIDRSVEVLKSRNSPTSDAKSVPINLTKPPTCIKYINKNLKMCSEELNSMLVDFPDCVVIGSIGFEGVGKSTILSMLCDAKLVNCNRADLSSRNLNKYFLTQSIDTILNAEHETTGIDIIMISERLVLLDCQPLRSSSILSELIKNEHSFRFGNIPLDDLHEIHSLKLLTFLLTVCDILLVVQDKMIDLDLLEMLKTASMLQCHAPSVNKEDEKIPTAELVFVANKIPEIQLSNNSIEDYKKQANSMFSEKRLNQKNQQFPYFILPLDNSKDLGIQQSFSVAMLRLRQYIWSYPNSSGSKKSLNEWIRSSMKIYDSCIKSSSIAEYARTLQKIPIAK